MKYNKINYIFKVTTIASSFLISSCNKYLDYQSPAKLSLEQTFEDVAYTNNEVLGIYTELAGTNGYGNQLSINFPVGGDDSKVAKINTSFDPTASYAIGDFGANKFNLILYNAMVQLYNGIERANIACKYIPASKLYKTGTAAQKKQLAMLYGEALTLRAQYYYELIRNWGDVPASFIPAADRSSNFSSNVDRDSTYDHILNDLKVAENIVPWYDSIPSYGDFRITKGAVKGLRARIALARGGYSLRTQTHTMERKANYLFYYKIAFDECLDIINSGKHGLNPVYENIFKSLHGTTRYDDSHELMFEVAMFGQVNDSYLAKDYGLAFTGTPTWGDGGGGPNVMPTYLFEFDTAGHDSRREVSVSYFRVQGDANNVYNQKMPNALTALNNGKFRKSWTVFGASYTGTSGVNWPIIRYADILLMFAEAANELQDFSGSITPLAALQLVQQRAFGSNPIPTTPTDHDGFFNAIVKERLLEFGGEGIRKYDLIRWNMLAAKIAETKAKLAMLAYGAPSAGNPYDNGPDYVYGAAKDTFKNSTCATESFSLKMYGGGPQKAFFKRSTTTVTAAYPNRIIWRRDVGYYTNGVLTSTMLTNSDRAYALRFIQNMKELLPYPDKFITENTRGTDHVDQNYGY